MEYRALVIKYRALLMEYSEDRFFTMILQGFLQGYCKKPILLHNGAPTGNRLPMWLNSLFKRALQTKFS